MSERKTPETNKRIDEREPKDTDDLIQELHAADRHCRRLERERDAAVEALKALLNEVDKSGLGNAKDFGWPKVTEQARAVLAEIERKS